MGKGVIDLNGYGDSFYVQIRATPSQKLRSVMNICDRDFINGDISEKLWHKTQKKAIKKYKKSCKKA